MGRSKLPKTKTESCALDLNEENVKKVFEATLADEHTMVLDIDKCSSGSFTVPNRKLGIPDDYLCFEFDRQKIKKNKPYISYLYGQLLFCHKYYAHNMKEFYYSIHKTAYDYSIKYDGKIWTKNRGILLVFFMLLDLVDYLNYSEEYGFDELMTIILVKPTISPDDPAYDQYITEHPEWIVPIAEDDRT